MEKKLENALVFDESGVTGDTLILIPLKGKCVDYYSNGCIQRVIVYENGVCAYFLLFDENEFFIKRENCESYDSFCDFSLD